MFEILKSLTVVEPLAQRLSNHGPYVLMFLSGHFIFIDEEKFWRDLMLSRYAIFWLYDGLFIPKQFNKIHMYAVGHSNFLFYMYSIKINNFLSPRERPFFGVALLNARTA